MMRKLPMPVVMILSPLLVCAAAGIAYLVISRIYPDFAKVVAGVILTAIVKVYDYLKNKELKLSFLTSLTTGGARKRHASRWYLIVIYGTLALFGIINLLAGLGGVTTAMAVREPTQNYVGVIIITAFIGLVINPILFYLFGAWVGKKVDKHGVLAIILTLILSSIIDLLVILLIPESLIEEYFQKTKTEFLQEDVFVASVLIQRLIYTLVCILIALAGYWRGRRKRLSVQLQDFFSVLPRDIQNTVVDLVYEESTRMAREKIAPSSSA